MKHEFHAQFPFALQDSVTQAVAIPWLVGQEERLPPHWQEIAVLQDPFARVSLLAQAIVTGRKEEARMGTRKMSGGHRFWIEERASEFLRRQRDLMQILGIEPSVPPPVALSAGSWAIQFTFTLRTPYISKDDTEFYILENPVKKEWVFKVPYVAPSQWKGALQAAMVRLLVEEKDDLDDKEWVERRLQLTRLFGNEKGVGLDDERFEAYLDAQKPELASLYRQRLREGYTSTGFLAGRLHFYPTFFDRIGLEVINPHPRDTGAGKQPIYFECVPAEATGIFTLLYVPLVGSEKAPEKVKGEAGADLQAVAAGLEAMMTLYGFGAKTSSGYGVAKEEFVKDEQGSSQAIVWVKEGKRFRCRSFTGLRQVAEKLAEEWRYGA